MTAISSILSAIAQQSPDRVALDAGEGSTVSYAALVSELERTMQALRTENDPARPIAFQSDHGIALALLELSALEAGLPVLSLPRFFAPEQSIHAITSCGAQMSYGDNSRSGTKLHPTPVVPLPAGTARITFTSGSTGSPKGICLSAAHMLQVAQAIVDTVGSNHAGRHLALLPSGILLETVAGFFASLLGGGTYVCPTPAMTGMDNPFRPDFARMAHAIERLGITSLILVPEYLTGLVTVLEETGLRLPHLSLVAVGGACVSPAMLGRARSLGLPVRQGYGLTECGSVVALADIEDAALGSVGRVLPHMRAHIAPDGEIMLDGPLALGTVGAPRQPGPLATGDLGGMDDEGRLWIAGRKSNLIITSHGRNISPEWVEATLCEQPGIAQAMVHGEGRPMLEALLVPAYPHADLAGAVEAANGHLPPYARIVAWREVAHFTPQNGRLTSNGKLVRKAISDTYLSSRTEWFHELEADTVRERLRFLSIPQLQAGLAGAISRDAYVDYLTEAYHHVSHTVPLMQTAKERLGARADLLAALDEYITEEVGHESWILSDIAAAGGDAKAVAAGRPGRATQAMIDHAYSTLRDRNPVALFGMIYVLESVSIALAQRGASAVAERLGLPAEAFTYLTSHGALDQDHMAFFASLVNGFDDPADQAAIVEMAREVFDLYGAIFASIAVEDLHEPA